MKEELHKEIIDLKRKKGPGADNITAEMVKVGEETSINTLWNKIYSEKSAQRNGQ